MLRFLVTIALLIGEVISRRISISDKIMWKEKVRHENRLVFLLARHYLLLISAIFLRFCEKVINFECFLFLFFMLPLNIAAFVFGIR